MDKTSQNNEERKPSHGMGRGRMIAQFIEQHKNSQVSGRGRARGRGRQIGDSYIPTFLPQQKNEMPTTEMPAVYLEISKILTWFEQPSRVAVSISFLDYLIDEPINDTESLLNKFDVHQCKYFRYLINLTKVKLLMDNGELDKAVLLVTESVNIILGQSSDSEYDKELTSCYLYLFSIIRLKLLIATKDELPTKSQLVDLKKIEPDTWILDFVKSSFYQLFGLKGCHRALEILNRYQLPHTKSGLDNKTVQLLFIKARVLGKLKYLEQWTLDKWQEEEQIMKMIYDSSTQTLMYYTQFIRLWIYRCYSENIHKPLKKESNIKSILSNRHETAKKLYKKIQELVLSQDPVECLAWLGEELMKLPVAEKGMDNIWLVEYLAKVALNRTPESPYIHRVISKLYLAENKTHRALDHIDVAASMRCSQALIERQWILQRVFKYHILNTEYMKSVPNGVIHLAFACAMFNKNLDEAKNWILPYIEDWPDSPSLLAYSPVVVDLVEPVNVVKTIFMDTSLADFVQDHKISGCSLESGKTFITKREDILRESTRLKTNQLFKT